MKRGRPREETARRSTVCFRLHDDEYDRLIEAANQRGLTPAELAREAAIRVIKKSPSASPHIH